jgi:hypothetical protein
LPFRRYEKTNEDIRQRLKVFKDRRTHVTVQDLLSRTFRFNPAYQFIPFNRLSEEDRRRLRVRTEAAEFHGVLMPSAPGLSVKAICQHTATLLESLRIPNTLPAKAREEFSQGQSTLVRMVLDSVLEVQIGETFVSGASALNALEGRASEIKCENVPARLSLEALKYGQALECSHAPELSWRLYYYNRLPASPNWSNRIKSERDFAHYLGLESGSAIQSLLDREWTRHDPPPDNPGWLFLRSRNIPFSKSRYKLYISPHSEDLRETLRLALPVLTDMRMPSFKVARNLYGVLRPDKLIVYVPTFKQLQAISDSLLIKLKNVRAHGVPFTAGIDTRGLLSWGIDPPRGEQLSSWQGTSWRLWVTDRLAVALLSAKESPSETEFEPWQFALRRISAEGVDTSNWTPAKIEWAVAHGGE